VSAGNTGAVMAASLFILGRAEGVSRPAVIGYFPSPRGVCIVLDVGTNVDCKPEHLAQFARMGSIYAKSVLGRETPRVGLLNVGEEPGKGNELAKATYPLLEADSQIDFTGNVEGRDVLMGAADVVVCDGFVGNVLLKFGESVASVLPMFIGAEVKKSPVPTEHLASFQQIFGGVKKHFDYEEYGGAPLLGVNGTVLIGHGGSSARAIERMILTAAAAVREDVAGAIARSASA
jgi:phosphate acyltransferase